MSWSIDKTFKNVAEATQSVSNDKFLPEEIRHYITRGLSGIAKQDSPVSIVGSGHVCEGLGSYEVTNATLSVKPFVFSSP